MAESKYFFMVPSFQGVILPCLGNPRKRQGYRINQNSAPHPPVIGAGREEYFPLIFLQPFRKVPGFNLAV
jgi:hypothetical protein